MINVQNEKLWIIFARYSFCSLNNDKKISDVRDNCPIIACYEMIMMITQWEAEWIIKCMLCESYTLIQLDYENTIGYIFRCNIINTWWYYGIHLLLIIRVTSLGMFLRLSPCRSTLILLLTHVEKTIDHIRSQRRRQAYREKHVRAVQWQESDWRPMLSNGQKSCDIHTGNKLIW